jgi:uncharacterized protein involved in exopolysaccharide biosynthesis
VDFGRFVKRGLRPKSNSNHLSAQLVELRLRAGRLDRKKADSRKKLRGSAEYSVTLKKEPRMDNISTIDTLREQEVDLSNQISGLEATVASSSTPGIREFRLTRLRQLQELHQELSERVRRIEFSSMPDTDAYQLGTALREASMVVQSTFRA